MKRAPRKNGNASHGPTNAAMIRKEDAVAGQCDGGSELTHRHSTTASEGKNWSIGTYLRIRPNLDPDLETVQFDIQDLEGDDGMMRSVVELEIPDDADPGLVHNNSLTGRLRFQFNRVFGTMATQEFVFDQVAKDSVMNIFDGVSGTIFAYGQTGSGKTFSIFGGDSFSDRGLIARSISLMFEQLAVQKSKQLSFQFTCQVSFIEIYKETVYDLLEPERLNQPLEMWPTVQLMEGDDGMVLRNLNVYEISSENEALQLFFLGHRARITSSTAMNKASSRSHAVFTIALETEGIKADQTTFTSAKLNLVDLAGSERMYKMENTRASIREAKSINLSLHYLEQVIISLREQAEQQKTLPAKASRNSYIPYRNSVLTSILRDSLGGNCKSSFLLCMSNEKLHFEETVATCRFGQRCSEVKLQISANTEIGLSDQLKELTARVKVLEKQLAVLEEEKLALETELHAERELRLRQTQPRILTEVEKSNCKASVQELLSAAKQSIALANAAKDREIRRNARKHRGRNAQNSEGGNSGGGLQSVAELTEDEKGDAEESKETAEEVIEQSHDHLFETVEKMDKAVLVELSTALGGLVQSMFMERETLKQQQAAELMKQQRVEQAEQLRAQEEQRNVELVMLGDSEQLRRVQQLPQSMRSMLEKGALFVKISRMGKKELRFYSVTEDMQQLCWRSVAACKKNKSEHGIQYLRTFESVEADPNDSEGSKMLLRGRDGQQKNVLLECKECESIADNRKLIREWIAGLRFLVNKAHR